MDTYIKDVVKKLEAMMPEKEISSQKIQKNNGIERVGILIKSPEQNISPVLYIRMHETIKLLHLNLKNEFLKLL